MTRKREEIRKDMKKDLGLELPETQRSTPYALKTETKKGVTVNICNAAEKIGDYPEAVQKLVWGALHYQCEIETRRSKSLRSLQPTAKDYEKLTEYFMALRQAQKLILKMCKKCNLGGIIIEGSVKMEESQSAGGKGGETIDEPTSKKELVALGKFLLNGHKQSIALHVKNALDAGATRKEILQVAVSIMGDARLLSSIIELLRALRYEENMRAPHISVVDDVRE